jgi:hypothetical protein
LTVMLAIGSTALTSRTVVGLTKKSSGSVTVVVPHSTSPRMPMCWACNDNVWVVPS